MFKQNKPSRHPLLLALAAALLAVSTFEFPTVGSLDRTPGQGHDVAQSGPAAAAWQPPADLYVVPESALALIWNRLH
jgi:hypothetical protein